MSGKQNQTLSLSPKVAAKVSAFETSAQKTTAKSAATSDTLSLDQVIKREHSAETLYEDTGAFEAVAGPLAPKDETTSNDNQIPVRPSVTLYRRSLRPTSFESSTTSIPQIDTRNNFLGGRRWPRFSLADLAEAEEQITKLKEENGKLSAKLTGALKTIDQLRKEVQYSMPPLRASDMQTQQLYNILDDIVYAADLVSED
ncbi:hypothetical protein N0V93_010321 [Gnomoniopsis smithogilvyi]|uniref:Uncharacterized protein n=1 Tax=Gnomoniopsis smithogilvyi TaxID=1191159 RepID=A0A9W9CRT6_9PEZI|nr:hypothetical protein N0V93_010321 [Gnomoniopsis smithogilvyi]